MGRGPQGRTRRNAPYSRWWLCKGAAPGSVQSRSYSSPLVVHRRLAVQLDLDKDGSVGREESERRRTPSSRGARRRSSPGEPVGRARG